MLKNASSHEKNCKKRLKSLHEKVILNMLRARLLKFFPPGKETDMTEILKVSATSNPNLVAGAIAGSIRQQGSAELQAIGASAVNQAIKAAAIAVGYLEPAGIKLAFLPSFIEVEMNGETRTAIKMQAIVLS